MRIWVAAFLGFAIGNLDDHGPVWVAIKLAFTIAMFVWVVRLAKEERS